MKTIEELKEARYLCIVFADKRMVTGWVEFPDLKFRGNVICGFNEEGWEHVSIGSHNKKQLPTWEVMARLKDMFWNKDEEVVQIHPAEKNYFHGFADLKNVLHLWRPADGNWELMNKGVSDGKME